MKHADTRFELKSLDDAGHIEGLAAGIGDVDAGGDTILAGAFTKTLAARGNRPLPMLLQHDQGRPIGAWTEWQETSDGLYVKGRLTMAARDAQEAHALVRDGALTGLSVGYQSVSPRRDQTTGGRLLPELDLHEASLVTIPMHPRSRVTSVKAINGAGDIADLLRECGMSGRQAKAAAGAAWRSMAQHGAASTTTTTTPAPTTNSRRCSRPRPPDWPSFERQHPMKKFGMTAGILAASISAIGAMTPAERAKGRYMRAPDGHPKPPAGLPLEMKSWLEGVEQKLADHKVDAGLVREIKTRVDDLEQKAARRGGGGSDQAGASLGTEFARADGLAEFRENITRRPGSFQIETKAITTAANSAGALMAPAYRDQVVALPTRGLSVRGLLNVIPIESGSVEVPHQTSRINNAGMVAEGTLKPESSYAWEMKNTPVRKIAHWTLQSSEILADAAQLAGIIDTELRYGLDYVEDVQLLKGDGTGQNLTGMKPLATDYAPPIVIPNETLIDRVGIALLQVTLADFAPDGVVLHPSDWMRMRLLKNADGEYLLGDPGANVAPVLFGLPVVPTKGQSLGEFTVGEFRVAGTIYDRMTTTVMASTEDGDNFRRNLVTILAEKRLAFAVKQGAALVDGAFAA